MSNITLSERTVKSYPNCYDLDAAPKGAVSYHVGGDRAVWGMPVPRTRGELMVRATPKGWAIDVHASSRGARYIPGDEGFTSKTEAIRHAKVLYAESLQDAIPEHVWEAQDALNELGIDADGFAVEILR